MDLGNAFMIYKSPPAQHQYSVALVVFYTPDNLLLELQYLNHHSLAREDVGDNIERNKSAREIYGITLPSEKQTVLQQIRSQIW